MQQGLEESPGFSDSKLRHENVQHIYPKEYTNTQGNVLEITKAARTNPIYENGRA
jgi:hypothetical protein